MKLLQRTGLIVFGLLLAAAGLLLLEATLRVLRVGEDALYGDPFVAFATGRDLFEHKRLASGETVYATAPEKTAYFNYQEFAAAKTDDTYRIFTLGGSTTAGRPYDDRVSFSGFLRLYLNAMEPSRRWEVVNGGAISYASYRVVRLMKELARYSPDLFIIYTGHNEFLEERAYPPALSRPALRSTWIWLNGLRSYNLGRRLWQRVRPAATGRRTVLEGEVAARPDDWTGVAGYRRDDELRREVIAHFDHNLERMISIARASGAGLIFVVPASNLKDFSPFKSEHDAAIQPGQIEELDRLLSQGRTLLSRGDSTAAVPLLERAVAIDPAYADAHFRLGQARLASGDADLARESFVRARELDVAPLRALTGITRRVREKAEGAGVPVVDLPDLLQRDSSARHGHRIPGDEYFLDHVHPDIPIHSRIAERIAQLLTARGVVAPDMSWNEAERRRIYDATLADVDDRYYARRDLNLGKVLGWAGKTAEAEAPLRRAAGVLDDEPEVFLNLGIVLQKQRQWAEAARHLERAIALQPGSAAAFFNLGVVYAGLGKLGDAADSLRQALVLEPDYPEAHYNLGIVLDGLGRPAEARPALEAALRSHPDSPEIHRQLGLVHRALADWPRSLAAFERALEIEPRHPAALAGLAGTYARQEQWDQAEPILRQAIEAAGDGPESARMHFDLGILLSRTDRKLEAIVAYRNALAVDPGLAEASNNLGILLSATGDLDGASRAFVQAIDSDAEYAEAYFNLGVLYDRVGLPGEALQAITRAVELEDGNGRFHLALGMLLTARGQTERAGHHLEVARRLGEEVPPGLSAPPAR